MLLEFQKVQLRRHLCFPVIGLPVVSPTSGLTMASGAAGYRFFQPWGAFEWRMDNLNSIEEAVLIGAAYGSVVINAVPNAAFQTPGTQVYCPAGSSVAITLSGTPLPAGPQTVTYTATVPTTPLQFAYALAAEAMLNVAITSAGFFAVAPSGAGGPSENSMPLPEVTFQNAQPFAIAVTSTLVGAAVHYAANGGLQPPSMNVPDVNNNLVATNGYVPLLNAFESAYLGATQNLDTLKADVWSWNPNELKDRTSQYARLQRSCALFMGMMLGTETGDGTQPGAVAMGAMRSL